MNHRRAAVTSILVLLAALLSSAGASAYPAFYVGKTSVKRDLKTAHVVLMRHGDMSAVTLMGDYGGPLDSFAVVIPVPKDVTTERVHTLKRDYIDHLDKMTAPRFHRFWEKDPCETGKAQQEWERDLSASAKTDFLGRPNMGNKKKVPKELLVTTEPEYKGTSAEFAFSVVPEEENVVEFLETKGFKVDADTKKAVAAVGDSGWLVAEVTPNKLELIAGGRAQLSPIMFWTETPLTKLHTRLGLLNVKGMQDMVVYVFDEKRRYEVKNYDNVFPPTNLQTAEIEMPDEEPKIYVNERTTELYAALHDALLKKNPKGVLVEWAAPHTLCGEPCAIAILKLYEILSLGGAGFETAVPDEEAHPEPPEITEEQQKQIDTEKVDKTPKEKKEIDKKWEETFKRLARNKAMIARHNYHITRLHHRYDEKTMEADFEFGPAAHVKGGIDVPKGPDGEANIDAKLGGDESQFQVRFQYLFAWKGMQKCESPERWRWEKSPRTFRGRRDVFTAKDMGTADRNVFVLGEMIKTPIPMLGLQGGAGQKPRDAGTDAGPPVAEKKSACGCRAPGSASTNPWPLALVAAGVVFLRRRR